MGTRNLTCVVMDGEYKVAQYGQWDGYPSGQGITILNFLREKYEPKKFREALKRCVFLTPEQVQNTWTQSGANPESSLVSLDIADKHTKVFPALSRDTGGKILELIQESENAIGLDNDVEFAKDSLFCEWAYVIDLDKGTFEVYSGFNKQPLDKSERFYAEKPRDRANGEPGEYYPIRLVHAYKLSHLPRSPENFVKFLERKASRMYKQQEATA